MGKNGSFMAISVVAAITLSLLCPAAAIAAESMPGDPCTARAKVKSATALRERAPGRFLIVAHRGDSARFIENTLQAFNGAIAAKADLIETDLRESKDKVIVLRHGYAHRETAAELAKDDVIPLEPALALAKKRILLVLDMKDEDEPFLARVLARVRHHGMEDQVVFGLRTVKLTRALRKLSQDVTILGFLSPNRYDFEAFYKAGGDIGRIWEDDLSPALVKRARGTDGRRPIWITPRDGSDGAGVIDAERLQKLIKAGFDGVLVNDPVAAVKLRCAVLRKPK
jgi:glycerophosphoryl diester phosphodiesterase